MLWHRLVLLIWLATLLLPADVLLMSCELSPTVHSIQTTPMQISLKRSGGFTGIPLVVTINTTTLPPEESAQFHQLVEDADFFHLPSTIPGRPQPDRFQYEITVEEKGQSHHVTVGEAAVPTTLRPLINRLMDVAR